MNVEKNVEKRRSRKCFCGRVVLQTVPYALHCVADANLGHVLRCVADAGDFPTFRSFICCLLLRSIFVAFAVMPIARG